MAAWQAWQPGRVGLLHLRAHRLWEVLSFRALASTAQGEGSGNDGVRGYLKEGSISEVPGECEGVSVQMARHLRFYREGRKKLAEMMGQPHETFTEKDVEESLRYLFPSRLFARDARPIIKHPSKVFPERKKAQFDKIGRPLDAGYFTGSPAYHKLVFQIYEQTFSQEIPSPAQQIEEETKGPLKTWVKKETLENILAEELSDTQYTDVIKRLSELAANPPTPELTSFLDTYRREVFSYRTHTKLPCQEEDGSVKAVGKRKTATAVVTLREGAGVITVNRKSFTDYFPRVEDRQQVLYPLVVTNTLGQFDISVTVKGGGNTGQSGAVRLGMSKALLGLPGNHGDILEAKGLLIRDPRMVERKKPGQMKARRKFTWVKR